MFQVVHELPGRLRLRSPGLRRNPGFAAALAARLAGMPGVRAAEISLRTGSLLIRHDDAPGRSAALRADLGMAPAAHPPSRALTERLVDVLLDRLADRLLGAVAAALI